MFFILRKLLNVIKNIEWVVKVNYRMLVFVILFIMGNMIKRMDIECFYLLLYIILLEYYGNYGGNIVFFVVGVKLSLF